MQLIPAPLRTPAQHPGATLFLAGSTSGPGPSWRAALTAGLADLPVTVYDPARPDWDATWREDPTFAPFREQVEWESEMRERAAVVVVYFHPDTRAAVSLLELGLCCGGGGGGGAELPGGGGRKQVVIACCPEGYWKRGNVQLVCARYGVRRVDQDAELLAAVREALVSLEGH